MRKKIAMLIVFAVVTVFCFAMVGCGETLTIKAKEDFPTEWEFNTQFDASDYIESVAGKSLEMEAKYTDNGVEKEYLTVGLIFTPNTLNDVTITIFYTDAPDVKITKT